LAISAGVMVYLCFIGMQQEAAESMAEFIVKDLPVPSVEELTAAKRSASLWTTSAFFISITGSFLLDTLSNKFIERLNRKSRPEVYIAQTKVGDRDLRLLSMAIFNAVALAVHNFPEGVINFYSNLQENNKNGLAFAVAIAIHNIPEGIAVALPILKSSGSRWWAFALATLSGLVQPAAALMMYCVFEDEMDKLYSSIIFSSVSGIMVYIALIKLYPVALEYRADTAGLWLIVGMGIMALSLYLLEA